MKKTWSLAELGERFPQVSFPRAPAGPCARRYVGTGRYIRETPVGTEFGHVHLAASPAPAFSVRLDHRWPEHVSKADIESLDFALLEGLFEWFARLEEPLRLCLLSSTSTEHRLGFTTPHAVRIAAGMALADLVKTAGWYPDAPSVA